MCEPAGDPVSGVYLRPARIRGKLEDGWLIIAARQARRSDGWLAFTNFASQNIANLSVGRGKGSTNAWSAGPASRQSPETSVRFTDACLNILSVREAPPAAGLQLRVETGMRSISRESRAAKRARPDGTGSGSREGAAP